MAKPPGGAVANHGVPDGFRDHQPEPRTCDRDIVTLVRSV